VNTTGIYGAVTRIVRLAAVQAIFISTAIEKRERLWSYSNPAKLACRNSRPEAVNNAV
jgi:hypothetical protein